MVMLNHGSMMIVTIWFNIAYNGNITSFVYDERGNKIQHTNHHGNIESWKYDDRNNMIQYTDYRGRVESWVYDDRNNMIKYTDYEDAVDSWIYAYYDNGQLQSVNGIQLPLIQRWLQC